MKLTGAQKDFLLSLYGQGPQTVTALRKKFKEHTGSSNNTERFVSNCMKAGYMFSQYAGLNMWGVSRIGLAAAKEGDKTDAAAARTNSWRDGGLYDGAELRPFTHRAGALDALAIPSKLYPKQKEAV